MLIEIKKISKVYGEDENTRVTAIQDIDAIISVGDFIAVVGPSGSGKTTFLNIVAGILLPSAGEVIHHKSKMRMSAEGPSPSERTHYRLHNLGFIFQDYQLLPILRASENVQLPLQLQGLPQKEIVERSEWALEQVGIHHLKNRFPRELSGGQQQRISIARAVAGRPSLILADEPTANLDSKTAQDIINLFKKLNQEQKLTFVFSTHDQRLIDQVKVVWRMQDGVLSCQTIAS
ncbi:MAG: ABC transporter ATP-binding protein [Oligoflexia bacterium]|nr:ABC transporter ATP-binding protein [Oligoflexia bacterium]MBF0365879.1 ABC transporter ATP-binding protein [Oligoflexia bacterium]